MNARKKEYLSIVAVLVLIIAIIGVSYAAFSYTGTGQKLNTITTGVLTMSYEESDNTIQINKALPTTDATGKVRLTAGEYFDFTLTSNIKGQENINWEIAAEDITSSTAKKIDGSHIKLYLTNIESDNSETEVMAPTVYKEEAEANPSTGRPVKMMSLTKGTTSEGFSKKYRLRMYVDESYNPQDDGGDLTFTVKINVYGKTGTTGEDNLDTKAVANVLLSGVGDNGAIDKSDPEQTFIIGTDPNNYIWYSGKLWRAVSIDPTDSSVKLVTQWSMAAFSYNLRVDSSDDTFQDTNFSGSYAEQWLNDTSVDGFLGNLREPDKFIKTDSVWNATMFSDTEKPAKTTMVSDKVGLLNAYEYAMSYKNADDATGYLNNSMFWWTMTPYSDTNIRYVSYYGGLSKSYYGPTFTFGLRPAINLKSTIKIKSGDGTSDNPYRLEGDSDTPVGSLLSTRYSGEYVSFGTGENNLYRIVSHENGTGTKITSAIPLKDNGSYKTIDFGSSSLFTKDNTIGTFLNNSYLQNGTYLTSSQVNMIEDDTTWYLGTVRTNVAGDSYRLAKYQGIASNDFTTSKTTAKVGLLRIGELLSGQTDILKNNYAYWTLTQSGSFSVDFVNQYGYSGTFGSSDYTPPNAIRPAMNLKSNVIITGGDGTKSNPFQIKLSN